jgi:tetratricopeptide (TPR) repeat protein
MPDTTDKIDLTPEELAEVERITSALPGAASAEDNAGAGAFLAPEPSFEPFEDYNEPVTPLKNGGYVDEYEEAAEEEPVQDITGMIEEISDEEAAPVAIPSEEIELPVEEEIVPATSPFAREPEKKSGPEPSEEGFSALDELNRITSGEPLSVDAQDIPEDLYNPDDFAGVEEKLSGASVPAEGDFSFPEFAESPAAPEEPSAPSFDLGSGTAGSGELPDLSDISATDLQGVPEASAEDIPDINLDSFELPSSTAEEPLSEIPSSAPAEDFGSFGSPIDLESGTSTAGSSLDEIEPFTSSAPAGIESAIPSVLSDELPDIPGIGEISEVVSEDSGFGFSASSAAGEPLSFDTEPSADSAFSSSGGFPDEGLDIVQEQPKASGGIDLSDSELRRLKTAIMLFPPALIRAVKDAILKDTISESDTRTLVNLILSGRNENDIARFLEDRTHEKIDMSAGAGKRRVISSRSEYSTSKGRERQKILFKRTRIFALIAVLLGAGVIATYNFVYKPWKADRLITEGVGLILTRADISDEMKNYRKAEDIFKRVDSDYVKDYLPGYNRYGKAYFDKGQYGRSLSKFNAAYRIKPSDVDTLNSIGYFYKKVPVRVFDEDLKPNLRAMYYTKSLPAVERIRDKYDVAIDFYLKARHVDPKNVTALMGVGDVYFIKGEYLKARQYYESILQVDPDSVAGYSGLMNLFIERDSFQEFLNVYVNMREKDLFEKTPSPLLAKGAWYFLTKTAHDDSNIRIDYGVESERIKDGGDNPFPAVRLMLNALHKKDPEYPPLYLMYAKLSLAQKNLKMAKGYLDQAIDRAAAKNQRYFGALSMTGEYYYRTKDPVKSYKYLKDAVSAYATPADFTTEDYYKETEHPGRAKAVMGNIFYYYFDKVTSRFGDDKSEETLEEEAPAADAAKLLNYDIAMKKYEAAVSDGYSSPELHYNLGRVYYLKGLYKDAMTQWMENYGDFVSSPEMMYALGNAFYHENNIDSAKAEYQKLISAWEYEAEKILKVIPTKDEHIRIFNSLASAYNNMGAAYLRKGGDTRSNVCFWKAIEYSHRIGRENEFARVNLARTVRKKGDDRQPVLDENIPYSLDVYREDMRERHEFK